MSSGDCVDATTIKSSICMDILLSIKTHGSESRGQGGSTLRRPSTNAREYFTRTNLVKIKKAITGEPSTLVLYNSR